MLFGLGNTLRSLTLSPMNAVLQQVHRQARAHLETGGTAAPAADNAKPSQQVGGDFYLPRDLDPDEIDRAIRAKLGGNRTPLQPDEKKVIERKAGGRIVVPAYHILRLGDGRFDLGRRFMHRIIGRIRTRRMVQLGKRRRT